MSTVYFLPSCNLHIYLSPVCFLDPVLSLGAALVALHIWACLIDCWYYSRLAIATFTIHASFWVCFTHNFTALGLLSLIIPKRCILSISSSMFACRAQRHVSLSFTRGSTIQHTFDSWHHLLRKPVSVLSSPRTCKASCAVFWCRIRSYIYCACCSVSIMSRDSLL